VINLAHGAFFMVGAYLVFQFTRFWGWPLPVAYASAIAAVVVIGAVVEKSVLAPLVGRDHLDQVLLTYGLILIFDELAVILWGKDVQPAEIPLWLRGNVTLGPMIVYPVYRLALAGAGVLAAPVLSVSPGMGDKIIIIAFVVVVIGGIGSIKGAFVGALLVGLFDS